MRERIWFEKSEKQDKFTLRKSLVEFTREISLVENHYYIK